MEKVLIGVGALAAVAVVASFVGLFGFEEPLLLPKILYTVQVVLLCVFIVEKIIRLFNAASKAEFLRANWFEIPLLIALGVVVFGADRWFVPPRAGAEAVRHFAVGIYLVLQVVIKLCRTCVNLQRQAKARHGH